MQIAEVKNANRRFVSRFLLHSQSLLCERLFCFSHFFFLSAFNHRLEREELPLNFWVIGARFFCAFVNETARITFRTTYIILTVSNALSDKSFIETIAARWTIHL